MPDPFLSYTGSSGYGILPSGDYGRVYTPRPNITPPEYGIWDVSTGRIVSNRTGKPFTGRDARTGQTYVNGAPSAQSAGSAPSVGGNTQDVNQLYKPVDIVKAPDIASAQQDMMAQFKKTADAALKPLTEHLNTYLQDLDTARTAGKTATNIEPTIAALNTAQNTYTGQLDASNAAYLKALEDAAAATRGVVTQAQNNLPLYNAAQDTLRNIGVNAATQAWKKYAAGSGVPTGASGNLLGVLAQRTMEAAAPFEAAKINRAYDVLGQYALPVEQNIAGQNIAYAGGYLPGVAGSAYGARFQTAQAIQQLRNQVAGMDYENATRYLQALGVPTQMIQQIFSTELGQLGTLAQLGEASHYRGLQYLPGMNLSQPVSYDMSLPNYPQFPTRYPVSRQPLRAPNQPIEVGDGYQGAPTHGEITYGTIGRGNLYQGPEEPLGYDNLSPVDAWWQQQEVPNYNVPNTGTGYAIQNGEVYRPGAGRVYSYPGYAEAGGSRLIPNM